MSNKLNFTIKRSSQTSTVLKSDESKREMSPVTPASWGVGAYIRSAVSSSISPHSMARTQGDHLR